jgi:hypothetical protein
VKKLVNNNKEAKRDMGSCVWGGTGEDSGKVMGSDRLNVPTMTQVTSWEVLWMIHALSGRSTRAIWAMGQGFRSRG